jgi:hypothetical protein
MAERFMAATHSRGYGKADSLCHGPESVLWKPINQELV